MDLTGQTFAGYEVLSKLGEGGMGAVYKARQPMLNRLVAIKTIAAHRAHEPGFVERFMHEAATAAKLNHSNIVQVYTGGEQDGVHYLVEEFVEGESLLDRLKREGTMDPQEALAVCVFVAEGLKHGWDEARIVHRDIKPANIFLSNKGAVKVGDMGLAKSIGGESGAALTQSGTAVGTPFYMSPEQAQAEKELDFRADIYSLGCTLYHMLSGKKPYEAGPDQSPMSVMIKQATAPPPVILQVLPGCPGPVVLLLTKMLAKQPAARHASYDELIADLRRVHDLLGQPQANAPISTALRAAKVAKKKPAPMLIYGGIAATAAVVLVGGLLLWAPWKEREASSVNPGSAGILPAAVVEPKPEPRETPKTPAKPPERKEEVLVAVAKPSVSAATPPPTAGKMPALPGAAAPAKLSAVDEAWIASVASFTPEDQVGRVMDKLAFLNPKFDGKATHKVEGGKVVELSFSSAEVRDLSPLKALKGLQSLNCGGAGQKRTLSDLSPLRGLKLAKLAIPFTAVSDLSPLEGMPLTSLQISSTKVVDLSPLKGAPLTWLSCVDAPVKDLAPLAGMPLATLWIRGTEVTNLSPLRGMALKELDCETSVASAEANKSVLFAMKSLETIGGKPSADFWKEIGAPEDPWFKQVAALPAEQQVTAVMAKLKELNPAFDGRETHKIESVAPASLPAVGGAAQNAGRDAGATREAVVTELRFSAVGVTNIAPVKVLTGLKKLMLMPWAANQKQSLSDLAPLQGLPLTMLVCGNTQVSDLTPLKGMPLTILSVDNTPVSDLTPLAGMPLTTFWCNGTKVSDLSPLKGMPLRELRCDWQPVRDKEVLATLPTLQKLNNEAASMVWMRLRIRPGTAGVPSASGLSAATAQPIAATPVTTPALPAMGGRAVSGQPYVTTTGMELLYIPPGEFLMGSTPEERAWAAKQEYYPVKVESINPEGEQPRKAAIRQGFWLGRTEVTVGQWKQFVNTTGYVTDAEEKGQVDIGWQASTRLFRSGKGGSWRNPSFGFALKDNHPVSCVSWNDAVAFCEWLNERERAAGRLAPGYKIRLPTEAEWEYACRAGKQAKFWWGETKEGGVGRWNGPGTEDGFEFVSPVDHFGARGRNRFGLADMLGNVWELCLDTFDPGGAHEEFYTDKSGLRVVRGGGFYRGPGFGRCAERWRLLSTDYAGINMGFRVGCGIELAGAAPPAAKAARTPPATATTPPTTRTVATPTLSRTTSAAAQTGQPFVSSIGMEMLYIPPGEFLMGSTPEERAWANANGCDPKYSKYEGEAPRKTAVKQGFWLGRTEVTVGQWKLFVAATGYVTDGEKRGASHAPQGPGKPWGEVKGANWKDQNFGFKLKDNHAVSCISWNDAVAFCAWLNEREAKAGCLPPGFKVRLPTEAEWEYACRAGKQTKFWWGETKEGGDNRLNWSGTADGFEFVSPVDHYKARGRNKFGLADMLGNVREWCLDEFDPAGAHEEPYKGNPSGRVVRGGTFAGPPGHIRCAFRETLTPSSSNSYCGFRVAVGLLR